MMHLSGKSIRELTNRPRRCGLLSLSQSLGNSWVVPLLMIDHIDEDFEPGISHPMYLHISA